jgi:hypothetical protein
MKSKVFRWAVPMIAVLAVGSSALAQRLPLLRQRLLGRARWGAPGSTTSPPSDYLNCRQPKTKGRIGIAVDQRQPDLLMSLLLFPLRNA